MLKLLKILIIAALLVPFPITVTSLPTGWVLIGVDLAHADQGRGRGGDDDRDDDDDDDDDDRSGRRGGDDRDDDSSDRDDGQRDRTRRSTQSDAGQSSGFERPANLHLRYPNGWDEQILDGRYRLLDPEGRKVADRVATMKDLERMRAAAGL